MTDTETNSKIDAETGIEADTEPASTSPDSNDDHIPMAEPDLGADAVRRVQSVLESGVLADGPEVRAFEDEFATFCGTRHAVATSNGTTALVAALRALGLEDGDAVVTSPFSFVASANAIRLAGGTPVFADIDPDTYTLDPIDVERVVREREDVVGVLPVHLYGLPADMPALCDLAETYDLFVLEDACQAHGAKLNGKRVGRFGDAACFSFYPTKNMTTGEGGIITTDREEVAEQAACYVNHGRGETGTGSYDHIELGHNHRMTSVEAAIGRSQLKRLPEFNEHRRENAATYNEAFAELPLETPTEPSRYHHVYHQYTVRTPNRDELEAALDERNIGTGIYYETPIHRQPAYETISAAAATLPEAEQTAERVLSIPVHPTLSEHERQTVIEAVRDYYN